MICEHCKYNVPAHSVSCPVVDRPSEVGTLRDEFAMAALRKIKSGHPIAVEDMAVWSYQVADAMMRAREGK